MAWSFLWRFAVYGAVLATISTFLVGFVVGMFGGSSSLINDAAIGAQVLAFAYAATAAWRGASQTRMRRT